MTQPGEKGPATVYELIEKELGISVDFRFGEGVDVDLVDKIIVRNDPGRVALVIVQLGGGTIFVRPLTVASSSNGIALAASGGALTMNWRDDFILPALEWHGAGSANDQPIFVMEAIITGR